MRSGNLSVLVLQDIAHRSLQYTRTSAAILIETRGVLTEFVAAATRFHADHTYGLVMQKWMEHPNRIRAATHTCD